MLGRGYQAKEVKMLTGAPATTSPALGTGARDPEPEYGKFEDKPEEGKGLKDFREKANLKEKPTSADGKKGLKDLPSVISQVGNAASFLQSMYSQMGMVSALMSGSSQSSRKTTIEDSLSGALAILSNRWTYDVVIDVFDTALADDNILLIDKVYRDLVKNAMAKIYIAAIEYGTENIPVSEYTLVTEIGEPPINLVEEATDFYIQQYYLQSEDPYPGYIRWNSPDTDDFVYTVRTIGDIYYTSPQEEIYSISEQELAEDLNPYIENADLTATILNDLLKQQETNIENNTEEKTLGKGASGPNAAALAANLLGYMSSINNLQKSLQLPVSVLSQGKINTTLKGFEKQMTKLKSAKSMLKKAAVPPQAASALSAISGLAGGNLSSIASGIASSAVGSAVSSVAGGTAGSIASNIATTKIPSILKT
jgi:hypothetical protein